MYTFKCHSFLGVSVFLLSQLDKDVKNDREGREAFIICDRRYLQTVLAYVVQTKQLNQSHNCQLHGHVYLFIHFARV